jgi:hypothetical protein
MTITDYQKWNKDMLDIYPLTILLQEAQKIRPRKQSKLNYKR